MNMSVEEKRKQATDSHREYMHRHPEQRAKQVEWRKKNHQKILLQQRERYRKNHPSWGVARANQSKEDKLAHARAYYWDNREKLLAYHREYNNIHRSKLNAQLRDRSKRRMAIDIGFSIKRRLQCRLNEVLSRRGKSPRTEEYLGCSITNFKAHIESLFVSGMSWENRHLWHIDHIRPCASFDLTDPEQQRCCFHYTNLQPLWALDNRQKGAKTASILP